MDANADKRSLFNNHRVDPGRNNMNSPGKAIGVLCVLPTLFFALVFPLVVSAAEEEATLQWARTVALGTPVSGVIADVNVDKGEHVHADQVLLRLDNEILSTEVVAARGRLKQAENNRDEAQRELDRIQELYDRTLLSNHDLQVATIQRDGADADWLTASANLMKAEYDEHYSSIRAPFAAWVIQRNAQPGQTVVSRMRAAPLIVLAEMGRMLARSLVSGKTADNIERGDEATVTVAGKKYTGTVSFVALQPEKTGADRYAVEVVFDTKQQILRVGQPAKIKF